MKLLILSIILSVGICFNFQKNQEVNLLGTWKLIEIYDSNKNKWISIENGYTYTFKGTGDFTSKRFSECRVGTYKLKNKNLILNFKCKGFTAGIEKPQGVFIEKYSYENELLVITPTYLNCDEGCSSKFKKI